MTVSQRAVPVGEQVLISAMKAGYPVAEYLAFRFSFMRFMVFHGRADPEPGLSGMMGFVLSEETLTKTENFQFDPLFQVFRYRDHYFVVCSANTGQAYAG